jgi:hypothetical protein
MITQRSLHSFWQVMTRITPVIRATTERPRTAGITESYRY